MKQEQIKDLQTTLMDIMDKIHLVCVKENIGYYIIGGTALGAVRHKGFIPWDTDIDIAMMREDYDRFLKTANDYLPDGYFCASYENSKKWYHPHALVFKNSTMIHWNTEYYKNKKNCPVYVDIFPLDYAPDDYNKKAVQEKKVRKKIYLQSRRDCILYQHNSLVQRLSKQMFSALLRIRSDKSFNRSLDRAMSKHSSCPTKTVCSMSSHYSYKKQCMPKSIYGTPTLVQFENRQYYAPEMIEKYLTVLFGDYMKLPPKEQQCEYMDYIGYIDFGKDN